MAYTINISERQRVMLVEAVEQMLKAKPDPEPINIPIEDFENAPSIMLTMLRELSLHEKETPGVIHRFCF